MVYKIYLDEARDEAWDVAKLFAKLDLLPTAVKIVQIKNRLYENLLHFFLPLSRSIAIITLLILSYEESWKQAKSGKIYSHWFLSLSQATATI